jgi:hypothetical protein
MDYGDVMYPAGAAALSGIFVLVASKITKRTRSIFPALDMAIAIGTINAISVLFLRRPDLAQSLLQTNLL